jgi:hypothetical protein
MLAEPNPYQSPAAANTDEPVGEVRRPRLGTLLVGIWTLEAVFKTYLLGMGFSHGFCPLQDLANAYRSWNRVRFFLASSFFIIETVGPWIGIYYLTGRRARTIPFDKALLHILRLAGGITIVASLILAMHLELTERFP